TCLLATTLLLAAYGPDIVRCDKAEEGVCREFTETSPDTLRELSSICDRESVVKGMCPKDNLLGVCDASSIAKAVTHYYRSGRNTLQDAQDSCKRMGGDWNDSPRRD